jgi:hypothetical protein
MRHPRILPLLALLFLGTATGARAGQDTWTDVLQGSAHTWNRPGADLQGVAPGPKVPYSSLSVFVTQTGSYEISSDQTLIEPWDGLIFLYAETFDPTQPLKNLLAGNDNGPAGASTSKITAQLLAGVVYHVVTTSAAPSAGPLNFANTVKGPGEVRESYCFVDEPTRSDNGDDTAMSLLGGRFCVFGTWKDFAGRTGNVHRVPLRSDSSGNLWFFGPDNWEIQIKVLNGCGLNHNFWVMLSSTSNVQYDIHVRDLFGNSSVSDRVYSNALGKPPRTVLDTKAFDGCPAGNGSTAR